jgi:deazaflavin-dependent oxidoreductase (nitroreductase family)
MASREMPKALKYGMESSITKLFTRIATWLYRQSGGKIAGTMQGAPVLLLTTRGRKTGKSRTLPLIYGEDGNDLLVVASKGGWPQHPHWYQNLRADPNVEVMHGARKRVMVARTADAAERPRLWRRMVEIYKPYDDYQSWSDREIPVVILSDRIRDGSAGPN